MSVTDVPPARGRTRSQWGRSLLAVVTGVVIDLGGTNVVAICVGVIAILPVIQAAAGQNLPPAELQARMMEVLSQAMSGSWPLMVLGFLCSLVGGYVAAMIARRAEVLHGLAVGIGVTLTSVTLTLCLQLQTQSAPVWQHVLGLALNWGSTALGGYLAYLQRAWARRRALKPA